MLVLCNACNTQFDRQARVIEQSKRKHNGNYICRKCFWNLPEQKEKQRAALAESEAFKLSRAVVADKIRGSKNGMAGGHTEESKKKMSASRTGKFGENATAWKGGKRSLTAVVKAAIYRRHQWHRKIYERDSWRCVECGSTKQLDAHHTTPFSKLLKSIETDLVGDALIDWLADHPLLVNAEGITLCRKCHRAAHKNWGSHTPEINDD